MRVNITVKEAQDFILQKAKTGKKIDVSLLLSLNKVLAKDIYSKINIPPFNNSAMDGYAIIGDDTKGATEKNPKVLKIIGEIPAGVYPNIKLKNNCAVKISTGAIIPHLCDAVIRQEDTILDGGFVKILKPCKVGENIRYKGEDIKSGELILKKGTKIKEFELGILASLGLNKISVIQMPKVGIISTGNELIEPGCPLKKGKIYNSNAWTLYGLLREINIEPKYFGIVKDNKSDIEKIFKKASNICDIIISSGGVSVSEYDIVKDVILKYGKIFLWKVAMRPGHPLSFGKVNRSLFFGLPGNPVSAVISFLQFVRPAILKISGYKDIFLNEKNAILDEDIEKKKGFVYFLRGITYYKNGKFYCKTTGPQGSGILKSLLLANVLLVLPEDAEFIKKGDEIKIQLLPKYYNNKTQEV